MKNGGPSGYVKIAAIVKMTIEIVDFPMKNGGFSIVMLNYQRVPIKKNRFLAQFQC